MQTLAHSLNHTPIYDGLHVLATTVSGDHKGQHLGKARCMDESMLLLLQGLHQKGDVQRSLLLEKKNKDKRGKMCVPCK